MAPSASCYHCAPESERWRFRAPQMAGSRILEFRCAACQTGQETAPEPPAYDAKQIASALRNLIRDRQRGTPGAIERAEDAHAILRDAYDAGYLTNAECMTLFYRLVKGYGVKRTAGLILRQSTSEPCSERSIKEWTAGGLEGLAAYVAGLPLPEAEHNDLDPFCPIA